MVNVLFILEKLRGKKVWCIMDFFEYKDICRICLDDNVLLDWNTSLYQFHDTTYKDCYYKYTQLECYATDPFPQMLCRNCCKALHSTHTLILRALESQKVLHDKFSSNSHMQEELSSPSSNNSTVIDIHHTPEQFETVLVEEIEIEHILDDHFEFEGSCDEDISLACKSQENYSKITKGSKAVLENINIKPKRELYVKEINKSEAPLNDQSINSLEMNATIRKTKPINDSKNKMIIEFISEDEETLDCNSIEYNLIDDNTADEDLMHENKAEEEGETVKVESKAKKKRKHEPRMCSICSKILRNKKAVELHEQTHIENRERKETCKVCGLKFYDQRNLYSHMHIHKENREKRHKCEFCSKAFYDKGALNVHRRIHLGQMIPCSLCSKQYYRQVDLDRHMNSHSATTINCDTKKISKYLVRCQHCDKSISSTSFKSHTAAHLNEPLVKCSICDKEFFTRKSCVRHVKKNHQKTNEEYKDFIVMYSKNRISHLFLKQNADVQVNSV